MAGVVGEMKMCVKEREKNERKMHFEAAAVVMVFAVQGRVSLRLVQYKWSPYSAQRSTAQHTSTQRRSSHTRTLKYFHFGVCVSATIAVLRAIKQKQLDNFAVDYPRSARSGEGVARVVAVRPAPCVWRHRCEKVPTAS